LELASLFYCDCCSDSEEMIRTAGLYPPEVRLDINVEEDVWGKEVEGGCKSIFCEMGRG
jgi:hypothetical protein